MKWGVLCLLALNMALWVAADVMTGHLQPRVTAHGRLPRVASLEIVSQDASGSPGQPASRALAYQDAPTDEVVAAGEQACLIVGWFDSQAAARRAAKQTKSIPDESTVRPFSRPAQPYHWVILPPASSQEAALKRLAEIQQRGIDSYLVTEGVHANAISLGLFESREAAEAVLSRSQSQGLEATLATLPRNQIRYALVFPAQFRDGEDSLSQSRRELENRFGSVAFGRCEGVANLQKNP